MTTDIENHVRQSHPASNAPRIRLFSAKIQARTTERKALL